LILTASSCYNWHDSWPWDLAPSRVVLSSSSCSSSSSKSCRWASEKRRQVEDEDEHEDEGGGRNPSPPLGDPPVTHPTPRLSLRSLLCLAALLAVPATGAAEEDDAYLRYLRSATEFQPVAQNPQVLLGRWDTWLYMPWRYQWTIGTGDEGGQFCRDTGINGGFTDHGTGPFEWFDKWHLRFYNDHTAGKGFLFLRGANQKSAFQRYQRDPRAVRSSADGPQPLDDAQLGKLRALVTQRVNVLKRSPERVAYALDDEVSWGAFVIPLPWRVNADDEAYQDWLARVYGRPTPKAMFVGPDVCFEQLDRPIRAIDFSPFLERMAYNDSLWANFLGRLVEAANEADPDTPCGIVGAQAPNLWGGYDYAKLMKKVQFIEAYNLGSASAIARSFNPQNALPIVTTHFHSDERGTADDIWQAWYYFAHGNRGMIGWVEKWFDDKTPRPWLREFAPTLKELGGVQGPKLVGAQWLHDGVAIYYSHPSIQVSWILDSEAHGKTWVNRNGDHRLGTSHLVRQAWLALLADSGLQANFLSYDQVALHGIPLASSLTPRPGQSPGLRMPGSSSEDTESEGGYSVLILPACYALSDIEAKRITEFAEAGGTVIADFACGLFDQHGKGRTRGALDFLFAVPHEGRETRASFFGGKLWVETDQDAGFYYKKYRELFDTIPCRLEDGYAVAERQLGTHLVRQVGEGRAVYLNLSPQRYLQYRQEGTATDAHREVFLRHLRRAGVRPRVTLVGPDDKRPPNLEVTFWRKSAPLPPSAPVPKGEAQPAPKSPKGDGEGKGAPVPPLPRGEEKADPKAAPPAAPADPKTTPPRPPAITYLFVVQNPDTTASETGGGGAQALQRAPMHLTLHFPYPVSLTDERTGKSLGHAQSFPFDFNPIEAAFFRLSEDRPKSE
jgi:hypothetical protein